MLSVEAKLTAATWSASLRTAISGSAPAAHPLPPAPQHHARSDAAPQPPLLLSFLRSVPRGLFIRRPGVAAAARLLVALTGG